MKKILLFAWLMIPWSGSLNAQTYCTAGPSSTADSELYGVVLTGQTYSISQIATGCGTAGVQDFTSTDSADLDIGASYTLDVTSGSCGFWYYSGHVAAWIDWNADGDFNDAGEEVLSVSAPSASTYSTTITVPPTAVLGPTRMRVMQRESGSATSTTPCATFSWGAVEDYRIWVTGTPPACPVPTQFVAAPSTNSMGLTWDGSANYYIIEYGPTGFTVGSGDTAWSYTLSEVITGLSPATTYDFHITAYCTSGASPAAATITATTSCAAEQVSWSEGFETWNNGTTTTVPACFSGVKTSTSGFGWTIDAGGTPSSGTGPASGNSGDWYVYLETSGFGLAGSVSYFELPAMDLSTVTSPVLKYYYHMYGSQMGSLSVEVSVDSVNWVVVDTISGQQQSSSGAAYAERIVSLASYITAGTLIRFKGEYGTGYYGDMAIDDIYVGDCPGPSNVSISSSGNATTVSWTSSASDHKIEYGLAGFTQGTGTQISPATSPAVITGLMGSTTYDLYIQDSCSATSVTWIGPISFTTPQSLVSLPYYEGFETNSGDWLTDGSNSSWEHGAPAGVTFTAASQGSKAWVTNLDGDYNNNEFSTLTSPYIDNSSGSFDVVYEFDMALETENNWDESWVEYSFNDTLWTKLVGGAFALNWYNDLGNQWWEGSSATAWTKRRAVIPNSAGQIVHLRHVMSSDGSVTYEGVGLDEVNVYEIPCEFPVQDLVVSNVTSSSFDVSWTSNASSWEIETGPIGFGQATGVGTITSYTSDSVTISITACDSIDIYVRATCGATNGDWVGPITVGALCEYDVKMNHLYVDVNTCGDSATAVYAVVENKGMFDAIGFPVNTDVSGGLTASLTATYNDTLSVGESDSIMVGTFNSYNGAVGVNIVGYSALPNDQYGTNDSISISNVGYIGPAPLVQANDTICTTDAFGVLYAEPIAGLRYGWYASPTDTVPAHIGDSLIVNNPGQLTWYLGYEDPLAYSETMFAANNGGSWGNAFSILPSTATSVTAFDINTSSTALIDVYISYILDTVDDVNRQDPTLWVHHDTVQVQGQGYNNPTYVQLSTPLNLPGNQVSGLFIGTSAGLQYTNGTTTGAPFMTDSRFTIYEGWGMNSPTAAFMANPRNWNGRIYYDAGGACSDSMVPVSVEYYSDTAQADFTFTIGADGYTVFFDASNSVGNVFTWDFGDGTTGSGDTITHAFADSVDVYAICLFVDDTVCMTSDLYCDGLVTTVGIDEGSISSDIDIYPNPTSGHFNVEFITSEISEYNIEIIDITGRVVSSKVGNSTLGSNAVQFDLELPDGVYMLRINLNGNVAHSRLVIGS